MLAALIVMGVVLVLTVLIAVGAYLKAKENAEKLDKLLDCDIYTFKPRRIYRNANMVEEKDPYDTRPKLIKSINMLVDDTEALRKEAYTVRYGDGGGSGSLNSRVSELEDYTEALGDDCERMETKINKLEKDTRQLEMVNKQQWTYIDKHGDYLGGVWNTIDEIKARINKNPEDAENAGE